MTPLRFLAPSGGSGLRALVPRCDMFYVGEIGVTQPDGCVTLTCGKQILIRSYRRNHQKWHTRRQGLRDFPPRC